MSHVRHYRMAVDWVSHLDVGPPFLTDPDRACAPGKVADPEVFFPPMEGRGARAKAVAVCRRCPFMRECDEWATATGEEYGIWGGRLHAPPRRERHKPRR
jgi:Transcription factor WhiB